MLSARAPASILVGLLAVCTLGGCALGGCARYDGAYHRKRLTFEIPRVGPQRTRQLVRAGKALLVCAYADALSFEAIGLDGAISLQTFRRRHRRFPSDQLVIFY